MYVGGVMTIGQINNIISNLKDGIENIPIDELIAFYKKCPFINKIESFGRTTTYTRGPDIGSSLKEALEQWVPKEKKDEQIM